jgi:hypothetical protein
VKKESVDIEIKALFNLFSYVDQGSPHGSNLSPYIIPLSGENITSVLPLNPLKGTFRTHVLLLLLYTIAVYRYAAK